MVVAASEKEPIVVPDTSLLTAALAAFVRQRDYAAALVALRAFSTYDASLDPLTFYVCRQAARTAHVGRSQPQAPAAQGSR